LCFEDHVIVKNVFNTNMEGVRDYAAANHRVELPILLGVRAAGVIYENEWSRGRGRWREATERTECTTPSESG
jgi:hypothetical protein